MSTASKNSKKSGNISNRKKDHLDICVNKDKYNVESSITSGFENIHFIHEAMPELNEENINTKITFLDHEIKLPLFISCMTGGSTGGLKVNIELAKAAQSAGIPVGLGSIRILFREPEYFEQFHIKPIAKDVPVLANIGSVQIRDIEHNLIYEMIKRLEVQAIVIHLNPGQEIFQPKGDRDFIGIFNAVSKFTDKSPVPVIVKETGFGIRASRIRQLLNTGVSYIDLAGAGGTNWITVESHRLTGEEAKIAKEFSSWGIPTAMLMDSIGSMDNRILASGGLRNGIDLAKSIALGAYMGGMALPFIREFKFSKKDGVIRRIGEIEKTLRAVMLLTGSHDIHQLRQTRFWRKPDFTESVKALKDAEILI